MTGRSKVGVTSPAGGIEPTHLGYKLPLLVGITGSYCIFDTTRRRDNYHPSEGPGYMQLSCQSHFEIFVPIWEWRNVIPCNNLRMPYDSWRIHSTTTRLSNGIRRNCRYRHKCLPRIDLRRITRKYTLVDSFGTIAALHSSRKHEPLTR